MMNRRYNQNKKQYIKLQEGEKFCPKCDGKGRVPKNNNSREIRFAKSLNCDKCMGDGKLDWVEEATGKKQNNFETRN